MRHADLGTGQLQTKAPVLYDIYLLRRSFSILGRGRKIQGKTVKQCNIFVSSNTFYKNRYGYTLLYNKCSF